MFERTPPRQTCVSLWQTVKFSFGSEVGHRAVPPLHMPSLAHSDSCLQLSLEPLKVHCSVQHGPWLGLWGKNRIQVNQQLNDIYCELQTEREETSHLTCTVYRAEVCTFCPLLHWHYSSRGLCTDHCSHSHTALQLPQVHFHILAVQILCTGTYRRSESVRARINIRHRERREFRENLPTKQSSFFFFRTALMLRTLQIENLLLLGLSPDVALAYII